MITYSKSFRSSFRNRTESIYDRARRKLTASFRSGEKQKKSSKVKLIA